MRKQRPVKLALGIAGLTLRCSPPANRPDTENRQDCFDAVSRLLVVTAATALTVLCTNISVAAAQSRSGAGTLTCTANAAMEITTNLGQPIRCNYVSPWGRTHAYSGVIARFEGDAA